ncbi:MAG TPA: SpoIIE family protein phosphatase, partial [Elusimicrobiota bacterium]|nr:SpoIIE family protein phosphatase [Elusimicrobiota bacterium]
MAVVFLYSNVIAVHSAESSFWADRKQAAQRMKPSSSADTLPSSNKNDLSAEQTRLLAQLPSTIHMNFGITENGSIPASFSTPAPSSSDQKRILESTGSRANPQSWISTLVLPYGSIRDIYLAKHPNAPMIIHIQDAHGIPDAQRNISSLISGLQNQQGISLVGLEGASEAFALDPYRNFPEKEVVEGLANHFLNQGYITGPELAGLTNPKPPLLWGVEDLDLHEKNVKAYSDSDKLAPQARTLFRQLQRSVEESKESLYSDSLREFDLHQQNYQTRKEPLGKYVSYLVSTYEGLLHRDRTITLTNLHLLMDALTWENQLDFKKVERERVLLVEEMVGSLREDQLSLVVQKSMAYRLGQLTYGEYYRFLRDLCRANRIDLDQYDQLSSYITYVLIAERINRNDLLDELALLEKRLPFLLAQNDPQKKLVRITQQLNLLNSLFKHEMVPADWINYETDRADILTLPARLKEVGHPSDALPETLPENLLRPFETFCSAAISRNNLLIENLMSKMQREKTANAILIAGGFHTDGLTRLLRTRDVSYVVVVPKINEVPKDGSEYLDVFARDPVPLEKLFSGSTIELAPRHALNVGADTLTRDRGDYRNALKVRHLWASFMALFTDTDNKTAEQLARNIPGVEEFKIQSRERKGAIGLLKYFIRFKNQSQGITCELTSGPSGSQPNENLAFDTTETNIAIQDKNYDVRLHVKRANPVIALAVRLFRSLKQRVSPAPSPQEIISGHMKNARVTADTSIGPKKTQEDRYINSRIALDGIPNGQGQLMIVADGHPYGKLPGDEVAQIVQDQALALFQRFLTETNGDIGKAIRSVVEELMRLTDEHDNGTTMSLVYVSDSQAQAHVAVLGDSPVLIRDKQGQTWENTANWRTLGDKEELGDFRDREFPQYATIDLGPESMILVASDGLSAAKDSNGKKIGDIAIAFDKLIQGADAAELVQEALNNESDDNVTAIVWRAQAPPRTSSAGKTFSFLKSLSKIRIGNTTVETPKRLTHSPFQRIFRRVLFTALLAFTLLTPIKEMAQTTRPVAPIQQIPQLSPPVSASITIDIMPLLNRKHHRGSSSHSSMNWPQRLAVMGATTLGTILLADHANQKDLQTILLIDVVGNGIIAGVGAYVNDADMLDGFAWGSAGGLLMYGGKEITRSGINQNGYGIPAKVVHSLGVSMRNNVMVGDKPFDRYEIDFGPLLLSFDKKAGYKPEPRILPLPAFAVIANTIYGNKIDLAASSKVGALVFEGTIPFVDDYASGMTLGNVFTLKDSMDVRYKTITTLHEGIHTFQYSEMSFTGKWANDYLQSKARWLKPFRLDRDIGYGLLGLTQLPGVAPKWFGKFAEHNNWLLELEPISWESHTPQPFNIVHNAAAWIAGALTTAVGIGLALSGASSIIAMDGLVAGFIHIAALSAGLGLAWFGSKLMSRYLRDWRISRGFQGLSKQFPSLKADKTPLDESLVQAYLKTIRSKNPGFKSDDLRVDWNLRFTGNNSLAVTDAGTVWLNPWLVADLNKTELSGDMEQQTARLALLQKKLAPVIAQHEALRVAYSARSLLRIPFLQTLWIYATKPFDRQKGWLRNAVPVFNYVIAPALVSPLGIGYVLGIGFGFMLLRSLAEMLFQRRPFPSAFSSAMKRLPSAVLFLSPYLLTLPGIDILTPLVAVGISTALFSIIRVIDASGAGPFLRKPKGLLFSLLMLSSGFSSCILSPDRAGSDKIQSVDGAEWTEEDKWLLIARVSPSWMLDRHYKSIKDESLREEAVKIAVDSTETKSYLLLSAKSFMDYSWGSETLTMALDSAQQRKEWYGMLETADYWKDKSGGRDRLLGMARTMQQAGDWSYLLQTAALLPANEAEPFLKDAVAHLLEAEEWYSLVYYSPVLLSNGEFIPAVQRALKGLEAKSDWTTIIEKTSVLARTPWGLSAVQQALSELEKKGDWSTILSNGEHLRTIPGGAASVQKAIEHCQSDRTKLIYLIEYAKDANDTQLQLSNAEYMAKNNLWDGILYSAAAINQIGPEGLKYIDRALNELRAAKDWKMIINTSDDFINYHPQANDFIQEAIGELMAKKDWEALISTANTWQNYLIGRNVILRAANEVPSDIMRIIQDDPVVRALLETSRDPNHRLILNILNSPDITNIIDVAGLLHLHIAEGIPLQEINRLVGDPAAYMKTLMRLVTQENLFGAQSIHNSLRSHCLAKLLEINDLHEENDATRFASVKDMDANEIYTIMGYGAEEAYTSTFVGLFSGTRNPDGSIVTKGLLDKMKDEGLSGDQLLEKANYNKFREFLNLTATYKNKLPDFLETMTADKAELVMRRFVQNLDQTQEPLREATVVANAIGLLQNPAQIAEIIQQDKSQGTQHYTKLQNLLRFLQKSVQDEYVRMESAENQAGMVMYGLLGGMFHDVDGGVNEWSRQMAEKYPLPDLNVLRLSDMTNPNGIHVQKVFFYGDDDGESSYASLYQSYQREGWRTTDRGSYVFIQSTGGKNPVYIFVVKPNRDDRINEQGSNDVDTYLNQAGLRINEIAHGGHSYWLNETLSRTPSNIALFFARSCGGADRINDILDKAPNAHIISTNATGTQYVNGPIQSLKNRMLNNGQDISWDPFWNTLSRDLSGNDNFQYYVPPNRNFAALYRKAYENAIKKTSTTRDQFIGLSELDSHGRPMLRLVPINAPAQTMLAEISPISTESSTLQKNLTRQNEREDRRLALKAESERYRARLSMGSWPWMRALILPSLERFLSSLLPASISFRTDRLARVYDGIITPLLENGLTLGLMVLLPAVFSTLGLPGTEQTHDILSAVISWGVFAGLHFKALARKGTLASVGIIAGIGVLGGVALSFAGPLAPVLFWGYALIGTVSHGIINRRAAPVRRTQGVSVAKTGIAPAFSKMIRPVLVPVLLAASLLGLAPRTTAQTYQPATPGDDQGIPASGDREWTTSDYYLMIASKSKPLDMLGENYKLIKDEKLREKAVLEAVDKLQGEPANLLRNLPAFANYSWAPDKIGPALSWAEENGSWSSLLYHIGSWSALPGEQARALRLAQTAREKGRWNNLLQIAAVLSPEQAEPFVVEAASHLPVEEERDRLQFLSYTEVLIKHDATVPQLQAVLNRILSPETGDENWREIQAIGKHIPALMETDWGKDVVKIFAQKLQAASNWSSILEWGQYFYDVDGGEAIVNEAIQNTGSNWNALISFGAETGARTGDWDIVLQAAEQMANDQKWGLILSNAKPIIEADGMRYVDMAINALHQDQNWKVLFLSADGYRDVHPHGLDIVHKSVGMLMYQNNWRILFSRNMTAWQDQPYARDLVLAGADTAPAALMEAMKHNDLLPSILETSDKPSHQVLLDILRSKSIVNKGFVAGLIHLHLVENLALEDIDNMGELDHINSLIRLISQDSVVGRQSLEKQLKEKASHILLNINELHSRPDEERFASVSRWNARETYNILVYGGVSDCDMEKGMV